MIPLVAFALALQSQEVNSGASALQTHAYGVAKISRPGDSQPSLQVQWNIDPLEPMRPSPKKFGEPPMPWEFPWVAFGYGTIDVRDAKGDWHKQMAARFRVYDQERKETNDQAIPVTRMLLALWEEAKARLNYDHSTQYDGQIVDVFLCFGGKPGGEQRFDIATEGNRVKAVDTIYIYDTSSFTIPIEMAREVAHEYGHAVLPAIGGFTEPENWANGYLGEKLFLRWVRDDLKSGHLTLDDTLGAKVGDLDHWIAANVDPLIAKAATTLPSRTYLADSSAAGMNKYIGLALYADTILPEDVFGQSMRFTGSTDATDYPDAIVAAAEVPLHYDIRINAALANRPIWIPLGKGKLSGARIIDRHGQWAQIIAPAGTLSVINRSE